MATRTSILTELFEPVVKALGYQLWGVEYISQGRYSTVRVYIEKDGGVGIEDCAETSRQISGILDVEDPISGEYTLEVSSPGLDRILFNIDHFKEYAGNHVKLRLTESFDGRRNFSGLIKAIVDDEVLLIIGDEEYTLPYELIEKANLVSQV